MALTDLECKNLKCPEGQAVKKLADGNRLSLWAYPNKRKVWRLEYTYAGKPKTLTIGEYPAVKAAEARREADRARQLIKEGQDPTQKRRLDRLELEHRQATTFEAVADEWMIKKAQEGKWTDESVRIYRSGFKNHLLPHLGPRPIADITPRELLLVVKKIETAGNSYFAGKLLTVTKQLFRYAIQTARREDNPADQLTGALKSHKTKHMSAIPLERLPDFLRALADPATKISLITRYALELQLLTIARPGEIRAAEWSEFDTENARWSIPAEKMKMRVRHQVPLTPQAITILEKLRPITGHGRYLFPKVGDPTSYMCENTLNSAIKKRMAFPGTSHGQRAVASTVLNESGLFREDVIEAALAHSEKNQSRRPYNRAQYWKERVEMAAWWANHLDELRTGAKVLPFGKAA